MQPKPLGRTMLESQRGHAAHGTAANRVWRIVAVFLAASVAGGCGASGPEPGTATTRPEAASPPTGQDEAAAVLESPSAPRIVQAGAPGEPSRVLMPGRTANERLLRMGQRIEISQKDEIALMGRWLADRGEAVPGGLTGHDGMDGVLMPGMLTPAQMEQLTAAAGAEFDRLFLQLMISHHEGALIMVQELFATSGAGQETFANKFAGDVDADQTMEIQRMQQMLDESR